MRNRNRGEISRRRFLGYSSVPLLAAWPGFVGPGLRAGEEAPQWRASAGKSISLADPPRPAGIEYINPDIPDFKDPEYPGEYYDALVPATLDLAERARLAIHRVTSMTNPNIDYEMYFGVSHMSQPPAMNHSASDMHCQGKFSEVLPLLRMMCGSLQNMNVETAWTKVLLKMQGPDGILYTPTTGRDWIIAKIPEGYPEDTNIKHFSLIGFGVARTVAAFLIYAQKDPQGPYAEAARKLVEGYKKVAIVEGDQAYVFSTTKSPEQPAVKPKKPLTVYQAGTQAWIAQYLAMYDRALKDPAASRLAEKMMNYNMFKVEYNEPSGRFKPSKGMGLGPGAEKHQYAHFHTHATNILACLYVYMQTGNKQLLDRAVKAYEWGISKSETLVGFFPMVTYDEYIGAQTAETCQVADMVIAAVTLSKIGIDKWDDVDRWTRNQLAENQLTQIGWVTDGHLDYSRSKTDEDFFKNPQRTTDRVAERTVGAFAGWPTPNDWVGAEDWWGGNTHNILYTIMNCCTAAGSRGLFSVWRDMTSFEKGRLRVHLLLNRASKWADIDSSIPYTGRVDVSVKRPLELELRIPEWVKPGEVECTVDDQARPLSFDGRYAKIGKVNKGQKVVMTFPISERTEKRTIEGFDYTFVVLGNDVVHVDPPGKYAPLYQRGQYRGGKTLYRKVKRFVSEEEFPWW